MRTEARLHLPQQQGKHSTYRQLAESLAGLRDQNPDNRDLPARSFRRNHIYSKEGTIRVKELPPVTFFAACLERNDRLSTSSRPLIPGHSMSRIRLRIHRAVRWGSFVATLGLLWASSAVAQTPPRPNIVFIMADDLGFGDVGILNQNARAAAGLPSFATPNIDSIALQGIRFNTFYSAPNCSPSRAMMLTGFHQGHTIIDRANLEQDIRGGKEDETWAQRLQEVGYATGAFGKWHVGGVNNTGSSIRSFDALPTQKGFETYYGPMFGNYRLAVHWESDGAGGVVRVPSPSDPTYTGPGSKVVYLDDLVAQQTVGFIRDKANGPAPFAAYVPFTAPHSPFDQAPPDHPYADAPWSQVHKNYAGMIWRLDQQVGQILAAIDDPNGDGDTSDSIANNTLVVFTSDNGPLLPGTSFGFHPEFFDSNSPFTGYKNHFWEGGTRVPFFVRWTGQIAPGQVDQESLMSFADVMPTLAQLAGAESPFGIDGRSFADKLVDGLEGDKNEVQLTIVNREYGGGNPGGWTLRIGDWKLVHRLNSTLITNPIPLLYNVRSDPAETTNLSFQKPQLVAALEAIAYAEGANREPLGLSVETPVVTETKNTYFTQYKSWNPAEGSTAFNDAGNWLGGTPFGLVGDPPAEGWNTGPADNWLASIAAIGPEQSISAAIAINTTVLALEVRGEAGGSADLVVEPGVTLNARNGVFASSGGVLRLQGGEINTVRDVVIRLGGVFSAHGTISGQQASVAHVPELAGLGIFTPHLKNAGRIEVRNDLSPSLPGHLTIDGDFTQFASGELMIDLGSGSAPPQPWVDVSDVARLGGRLSFVHADPASLMPGSGGLFHILHAADGIVGAFATIAGPTLAEGLGWELIYTPQDVYVNIAVGAGQQASNLHEWRLSYGTEGSGLIADFNSDGRVDGTDFLQWQRSFSESLGDGSPPAHSIPEPAAIALAFIAACTMKARFAMQRRSRN
ncbi:MAG: sulfatase-like hydrolase/transferase [Pirellulales bacterium]|nr:sulfatase-like hydrolase/transferase [Pirellulales bacterium]